MKKKAQFRLFFTISLASIALYSGLSSLAGTPNHMCPNPYANDSCYSGANCFILLGNPVKVISAPLYRACKPSDLENVYCYTHPIQCSYMQVYNGGTCDSPGQEAGTIKGYSSEMDNSANCGILYF